MSAATRLSTSDMTIPANVTCDATQVVAEVEARGPVKIAVGIVVPVVINTERRPRMAETAAEPARAKPKAGSVTVEPPWRHGGLRDPRCGAHARPSGR